MNSKVLHYFPKKPQQVNWQDYPAGYVSGAHGIDGNILISLFTFPVINIISLKNLRLYAYKEQVLEYKIKSIKAYKQSFIVNCGLEDRNKAEELKGTQLWLKKSFLLKQESGFILQFLGWDIFDKNKNKICGRVVDFGFNGAQSLLVIKTKEDTFFDIPFFKKLEHKIIEEKKQLQLSVTEGLEDFTYSTEQ
ncbi:MAG: hypothetical protein HAW60_03420 [Bdellovibrionales bacterium]|nr:hypothetical protein [Bdellovibrionales bacterium]